MFPQKVALFCFSGEINRMLIFLWTLGRRTLAAVGILILLPGTSLPAQMTDSLSFTQPADSSAAPSDSLVNIPKPPPRYGLDLLNYHLNGQTDSSQSIVYTHDKLIFVNYNGFADVFRNQPAFRIFDFMDPGQPRFVAPLHLLPHQSVLLYEGHELNEPVNGLYNTRFLSLDAVESVEATMLPPSALADNRALFSGLQVNDRKLNPEKPYSRLMFRQGDNGYTDLDIQFARRINDHVSIQLGGINKLYDSNRLHGVIYRASVNAQFSPLLSGRTLFRANREHMNRFDFSQFTAYHYREERDELLQDFTLFTDSSKTTRWHFKATFAGNVRTNSSVSDSFKVSYRSRQTAFSIDRNFRLGRLSGLSGLSFTQNRAWGNYVNRQLSDTYFNGFGTFNFALWKHTRLQSAWLAGYAPGAPLLVSGNAGLDYAHGPQLHFEAQVRLDQRRPNFSERYVAYAPYHGNPKLKNERMTSYLARLTSRPFKSLLVKAETGFRNLQNEILFNGLSFNNGPERSFFYVSAQAAYAFYVFRISSGGQFSNAETYLAPRRSAHIQVRYHDVWLNGALIMDAIGTINAYDSQNRIVYNPVLERFYTTRETTKGYLFFSYKLSATVKDAQLYMAMDNPMGGQFEIINGYPERFRRVRFGVNWVLWN